MAELLEVLIPMLVATAACGGLYLWRRGPFSLAMIALCGATLLTGAILAVYLRWFFDPYSPASLDVIGIIAPLTNGMFYLFWTGLPLLGLAHLLWMALRRRQPRED